MKKNAGRRIALVALDMDGTLLTSDKKIHADTPADIAAAAARGVETVYCSGRAVPEILPYVDYFPSMRYAVCLSGALVYDLRERKTISKTLIPAQIVRQIMQEGSRYHAMLQLLTRDRSVVRGDLIERMAEFHMEAYQPAYRELASRVKDVPEEAERLGDIPKINIYFSTPQDRKQAFERLKDLPLCFAYTEETGLEMNADGVSKASGLASLAGHLGISMEDVMGIGDADNDRTFLQSVGFSVAMGNSEKSIVEICDAVTDDNDHNGTGKAIRKYCLEGIEN